jgi:phosphonate transport system permease protein
MAMLIGIVLALGSCKVPTLEDAPDEAPFMRIAATAVRRFIKGVLALMRSVPEIVWAVLLVRMTGLGPGPAVLAIALTSGGIFGKLFGELAEAVDPDGIRALRRLGVGRFGILVYGVLPQVWRQWAGYAFYRLECSIRSAAILGVVGAGGLGTEISLSVRYFEYDKLATALLAILAFVILIEIVSALLRNRSYKWSVGFALVGSMIALVRLDIPWSHFTPSDLFPDWLTSSGSSDTMPFVWEALKLAGETVAMAWCATWVAALFALVLSPFTISSLSRRGKRKDAVRGRFGLSSVTSRIGTIVARLVFQISRASPELALAMVFVIWVGPGKFAGVLAICIHTIGVMGRLYSDVYEEVDPGPVAALEASGASRLAVWLYAIYPQAAPRLFAFTIYRFEVNIRATAMVGFVGAGGIGDALDSASGLFHGHELRVLLATLVGVVFMFEVIGDRVRARLLSRRMKTIVTDVAPRGASIIIDEPQEHRRAVRYARALAVQFRARGTSTFQRGTTRSLSALGMFIETEVPCARDTVVELELRYHQSGGGMDADGTELQPGTEVVNTLGRVVYTRIDEVPGMAIELFEPLTVPGLAGGAPQ